MDMTIRAMKPDERNYSYTQEKSVQKNTGCIGHLRGDMGRSGEEFYTSWDDHEASLKTETFKSEFNSIVNALRKQFLSASSLCNNHVLTDHTQHPNDTGNMINMLVRHKNGFDVLPVDSGVF